MHDMDIKARPETAAVNPEINERMGAIAPPVFIHAAPRTSSTWFWLKFRELPSTLCYYEPFNYALNWMTPHARRRSAATFGSRAIRKPIPTIANTPHCFARRTASSTSSPQ